MELKPLTTQATFLHDRLLASALEDAGREALRRDIAQRKAVAYFGDQQAAVGAYEEVAARLLEQTRELDVALAEGSLERGELVALTQNFYIRRESDTRGAFKAKLDTDRAVELGGRFSTWRLIGATGQSETFGHRRYTMLAYVDSINLHASPAMIELRPIFIGWRMLGSGLLAEHDDRREVWPQQLDQFKAISGKRATAAGRARLVAMSEEEVKNAFAEIFGEPFVPKDWGGETSDLFTSRLAMDGAPLAAAFAFKGPGLKGTLFPSGMGKRGDQALRLAHEPADLLVVQHHAAVAAETRNLLSAVARMTRRRFMVLDGETTAVILKEYGKLHPPA